MDNWCNKCRQSKDSEQHSRHKESYRKATKKTKDKRRAAGLCQGCGHSLQSEEHKRLCNKYYTDRRHRLLREGKCRKHPSRVSTIKGHCEECWFKDKAKRSLDDVTLWLRLKLLLESQQYKCAYSGKKLVPGKNASLDHKTPKSRRGSNSLDNAHWVDRAINSSFKNGLSHNNFLDLCKATYARSESGEKLDDFDQTLVQIWRHQSGITNNVR